MRILLTGDSLLARNEGLDQPLPRIDYELNKVRPQLKITNTAVSGYNSGDLLGHYQEMIGRFVPAGFDYLVIMVGTNDLATNKQVPRQKFGDHIEQLCTQLKRQGWQPGQVCFLTPTPVDENYQRVRSNALVSSYSEILSRRVRRAGFRLIDSFHIFLRQPDCLEILHGTREDGLHFGGRGYQLLARLLVNALRIKD